MEICGITYTSILFSDTVRPYSFRIPSVNDIRLNTFYFRSIFYHWSKDSFRIRLVNGRRWYHLYICPLFCHWADGFIQDSFGQWQTMASSLYVSSSLPFIERIFSDSFGQCQTVALLLHLSSSLLLIGWVLSGFVRSMADSSITCSSVFFSAICRKYLFRFFHSMSDGSIMSMSVLFHCGKRSFVDSFCQWQAQLELCI